MDDLYIPAGAETPAVSFEYSRHRLGMHGASFPTSAIGFYGPLWSSLHNYLQTLPAEGRVEVSLGLRYFSRSSAKLIRALISMLDLAARGGPSIVVAWRHAPEDEMTRDFGMTLRDEHPHLTFQTIAGHE